jgi:hypothetical protein
MKRVISTAALFSLLIMALGVFNPAHAQNLLPKQITDIFGLLGVNGSGSAGFVQSRIQLGLVLALGAVVLIAVVYSILSALKYIQSQGDAGKIEEAQKAIKAIFFGIGAMLIAIVGIVLVFVFFGASRPDPSLFQVCLSAPNSVGCRSCVAGDVPKNDANPPVYDLTKRCGFCESAYHDLALGTTGVTIDSFKPGGTNADCAEPIKQP